MNNDLPILSGRRPHRLGSFLCVLAILAIVAGRPALAMVSPPRGSVAPAISLPDLDGSMIETAKLAPRTLVLIFGELNHDGTRQACGEVLDALSDPKLTGQSILPILVVAQDAPPAQLKEESTKGRFPALILRDPKRDAFGAYRVLVMPTVVVVDGKGKVVHAMPGFIPRFKEVLTESLLLAAGKQTPERFDQAVDPKEPSGSPEGLRADRLVRLGGELTKHGLYDMAEARYAEATALAPQHLGAKLGLGDLMLRQDRLADAEPIFRSVLAKNPDSVDAAMGLAAVQIKRGGDDLPKAEEAIKSLLDKDASNPRAHFLLGQILERRGETALAAARYKKAAELLLDR